MITNEQIKNLCSRLRLYALPRLLESEAHLAQEQGKPMSSSCMTCSPARFRKETARTSNGG